MLQYFESSGNYLFSNNGNGYNEDSVAFYYFKNGIKIYSPPPPKDQFPYGYFADWYPSTLNFSYVPGEDVVNTYVTNILHLKAGIDDTLKIQLSGNPIAVSHFEKIWYNNVLKFNLDLPYDSLTNSNEFTIIH